ncbi:MAG: hypothetical protein C5B59_15320 [Bacteroidetes bacterium]|nr:MAG: hypothetical protein C5B59_15320 [Bacteroidota bacterium]
MRKLIIYGNCQAGAVANVLSQVPQIADEWTISVHELWKVGEEFHRQVADFADADMLLRQDVRNWRQHPLRNSLPERLPTVVFPYVYVAALWPFDSFLAGTDQEMVKAMKAFQVRSSRPFPFGFQDAVLARLRDEISDPSERLRRYRDFEFDDVPDLVRYAEFEEARLLNDDRRLGFTIGRYVVERYRYVRLFHAIVHPAAELIEQLTWEILSKIGIEMPRENVPAFRDASMKNYQVPVHPKVIAALGLTWVDANSRYIQPDGTMATFDEYFGRYADFQLGATSMELDACDAILAAANAVIGGRDAGTFIHEYYHQLGGTQIEEFDALARLLPTEQIAIVQLADRLRLPALPTVAILLTSLRRVRTADEWLHWNLARHLSVLYDAGVPEARLPAALHAMIANETLRKQLPSSLLLTENVLARTLATFAPRAAIRSGIGAAHRGDTDALQAALPAYRLLGLTPVTSKATISNIPETAKLLGIPTNEISCMADSFSTFGSHFKGAEPLERLTRNNAINEFKIGIGCGVRNGISYEVLQRALELGVRYFDTSTFYPVGALNQFDELLAILNIDRNTVHLSIKLWISDLGTNRDNDFNSNNMSMKSLYESLLHKFGVKKFDSVVVHWPLKVDREGYPEEFRIAEIWPQLEQLQIQRIVSEIGVSNFNIVELQRLLDIARIKPASLQMECNPYAFESKLVEFCTMQGIKVIAHSPFGFGWTDGHLEMFRNEVIQTISTKHNMAPAQTLLSWLIAKGVIPIPGTTNVDHVREIVDAARCDVLTSDDIEQINQLNTKSFHYLNMYDYFGQNCHKKYHGGSDNLRASIYQDSGSMRDISVFDANFMRQVKEALTDGAGFVVLPEIFEETARSFQASLASQSAPLSSGRWDGMGAGINSILNFGPDVLNIVDDPFVSLVVESLLGWDCKLDNITLSTSRIAPDNSIFGPHQDSPFDNNPGAPLPPPSYPLVLQVIVALDEFRDDNGPLYVIPYSHKKQLRVNLPWQGNLPHRQIPEGAFKAIVPKGSAIIAVGHIWHGTFSNLSTSPRMGMLVEFVCSVCDVRDKFTISSITPQLIESCSPRIIRLLNKGKLHQHDTPGLLNAFKDKRRKSPIPDFAKNR